MAEGVGCPGLPRYSGRLRCRDGEVLHGKGADPVRAGVVGVEHGVEASVPVSPRQPPKALTSGVVRRERVGDLQHGLGPGECEADEVGAGPEGRPDGVVVDHGPPLQGVRLVVGGGDGGGEGREVGVIERRQELLQPAGELLPLQDVGHERGLLQARGKEVRVAGLIRRRASAVAHVQTLRRCRQDPFPGQVPRYPGGEEGLPDREGGIRVDTAPHGAVEVGHVVDQPGAKKPSQRLEPSGPGGRFGLPPGGELRVELQDPGPPVGPFEEGVLPEVLQLSLEGRLGQVGAELLPDQGGDGKIGMVLEEPHQRPRGVDRRVPVPAAVERQARFEAFAAEVGDVVQVTGPVGAKGVGAVQARQGHGRESQGRGLVQGPPRRRRRILGLGRWVGSGLFTLVPCWAAGRDEAEQGRRPSTTESPGTPHSISSMWSSSSFGRATLRKAPPSAGRKADTTVIRPRATSSPPG